MCHLRSVGMVSLVMMFLLLSLEAKPQKSDVIFPDADFLEMFTGSISPECQFPFIYKDVIYTACATKDDPDGQPWCSTQTDNMDNHIKGKFKHCQGKQGFTNDPKVPSGNFPYFQKYTKYNNKAVPCVCGLNNNQLEPAECNQHPGQNNIGCYVASGWSSCDQAPCTFRANFKKKHVCDDCTQYTQAEQFCNNQNPPIQGFNTVFGFDGDQGKLDWALSQSGTLQKICMIPEYVPTWYCKKTGGQETWKCQQAYKICTGGCSLVTAIQWDTIGHFVQKSFFCIDR